MNLLMFTPALKVSAIGRMSALVAKALVAQGHDVTVVRAEADHLLDQPTHEFGARLVPWNNSPGMYKLAAQADAVFYHIGDHFSFHEGCLQWMPVLPGAVCLHDFFLGNLFHGWSLARRDQAMCVLRAWYGEAAAQQFFSYQDIHTFIEQTRSESPMTEWVSSLATAVITHSSWGVGAVLNACAGPVRVVPLAYDGLKQGADQKIRPKSVTDPFTVLTIGHIIPNKRVVSVIKAIGRSAVLREHVLYRLVGDIDPAIASDLKQLADDLGVELVISGEVDNKTLSQAIAEADVVSCLRWPSLEAASASAIEAMLYGKPTIVQNIAFYRELPDDCVIKIDPNCEVSDLRSALEQLFNQPELREKIGHQAKIWASATFTAQNYATQMETIAMQAMRTRPFQIAAAFFADMMSRWSAPEHLMTLDETLSPLHIFEN